MKAQFEVGALAYCLDFLSGWFMGASSKYTQHSLLTLSVFSQHLLHSRKRAVIVFQPTESILTHICYLNHNF